MWMMILMSGKWYAWEYDGENHLREIMDIVFDYVNNGKVVSIADDLDTWCDVMNMDKENVIVVSED